MILKLIMSFLRYLSITFFVTVVLITSETFAKKAAIVIDFDTKEVLFEVNANTKNYPASLTKIMTLYILFDQLENLEILVLLQYQLQYVLIMKNLNQKKIIIRPY